MEEFSDLRFKQHTVIEFVTLEKIPLTEIHRQM